MHVCLCNDVTESEIKDAIRAGHNTLTSLSEHLGVTTGCGTCQDLVINILMESKPSLRIVSI